MTYSPYFGPKTKNLRKLIEIAEKILFYDKETIDFLKNHTRNQEHLDSIIDALNTIMCMDLIEWERKSHDNKQV